MTETLPREKAKELIEKFSKYSYNKTRDAKQCALIHVNGIIEVLSGNHIFNAGIIEYWQEVKEETLKTNK